MRHDERVRATRFCDREHCLSRGLSSCLEEEWLNFSSLNTTRFYKELFPILQYVINIYIYIYKLMYTVIDIHTKCI